MLGLSHRTSCKPIFKQLRILTVSSLYIFNSVLWVRKHRNGFTFSDEIYSHNTRRQKDVHSVKYNLGVFKRSPKIKCERLYNKVPSDIKKIDSFYRFKSVFKEYLLDSAFYKVSDFLD